MLTAVNGVTEKGFTIMYMISQFVFGEWHKYCTTWHNDLQAVCLQILVLSL